MFLSKSHRCIACGGGGHRKSFVSVLENFEAKNLLAICLGVYTVGCVNSLKVKFFRHVAMNRHIKFKSVRFTTKIKKQGIYGHAFLTLVIIPQCHSFVILVIKPPFYVYLPNSSPVEHTAMHANWVSCYHPPMHAYSVGWHLSSYHLPSQPRLLPYFPLVHVACKVVACFFDYTYVWNLCSYYDDF